MQLSQDDLLFQMKLRVWDDAMDGKKFLTAIRLLDQTVSDAQAKSLFSSLKNNDGKVDVHILVRNLTGREFETVDFRNKIFSKIYAEIFPHQEEKMIQLLQEEDGDNLGLLRGASLLKVLNELIKTVSKADLERFVRFLDKDKLGRVSYMEFMGKMGKSNKAHNPFKTIVSRIAFFLKQNNVEIPALLTRLAQSIEGS
jgi:Ca2+-binding EF-hand superfamily protein